MKKLLTTFACLALVVLGAVGLMGCGSKAAVSFGKVSGFYRETDVTIAATKWTRQKDEEGFEEVWKFDKQTIAYNADALKAFGAANTVALTFNTKGHDMSKAKIYKDSLKTPEVEKTELTREIARDDKNEFHYFTSFDDQSRGFVIYIDWAEDDVKEGTTVTDNKLLAYKFIVNGAEDVTNAPAPAAA